MTLAKRLAIAASVAFIASSPLAQAQILQQPRRHDRPPGPPTAVAEAVQKMTVPEGFAVEVVAAEPDLINPVSMAIDERGRFWITESLEYPRLDAGVGRDRVKVLEDTDGDGRIDKTTVFADGLNIPSGIALGDGGIYVANSPDLLFIEDTDGDLKADKTSVLLTGFGRTDTHELPSALTWGPDGWLYGLNGVFNYSQIRYGKDNPNAADQTVWPFTCAMWRLNRWDGRFEIFAEGTSNPWGIAFDDRGEAFLSACVIDHLWHFVENAYYIRQGGPYPGHTWPMRSIVDHKHQKAAYCGITYYDSDAYPAEYRHTLYMGNIHGGCLNSDVATRQGGSYWAKPRPDLMTANDPWFMPVSQATGPDGNLYVLDWYDQYHCYQDANADPAGIERARGRLYRLVYRGEGVQRTRFTTDASSRSTDDLIALLDSPNGFARETARRLLMQQSDATAIEPLQKIVCDKNHSEQLRLGSLWTLGGMRPTAETQQALLRIGSDAAIPPLMRAWAVRMIANTNPAHRDLLELAQAIPVDAPVVPMLLAAMAKAEAAPVADRTTAILQVTGQHADDQLIQHVGYQSLRKLPLGRSEIDAVATSLASREKFGPYAQQWLPSFVAYLADEPDVGPQQVAAIARPVLASISADAVDTQTQLLRWLQSYVAADKGRVAAVSSELGPAIERLAGQSGDVATAAVLLSASLGRADSGRLQMIVADDKTSPENLKAAIATLVRLDPPAGSQAILDVLGSPSASDAAKNAAMDAAGGSSDEAIARFLVDQLGRFSGQLAGKAIETLTQRPKSSAMLLQSIADGRVASDRLNMNQLQRLSSFESPEVRGLLEKTYGSIRTGGSNRSTVVNRMGDMLSGMSGDPFAGRKVFERVCSQCHVLHGAGMTVGPDITSNGRNDWRQLIQNVFDPSAVIGPGFHAEIVQMDDDRILTGVPVEETEDNLTLRVQGGKTETLAKSEIAGRKRSDASLMPEQIEAQMTSQEIADLFAYLALDKPPEDPQARLLSGAPTPKR